MKKSLKRLIKKIILSIRNPNKKEFKTKYTISVIDKITLDVLMVLMIKGEEE